MLDLVQSLRLEQRLSPQLIQSLKLLQMPSLELEQRIQQELDQNPLLEELESGEEPDEAPDGSVEEGNEDEGLDAQAWETLLDGGFDPGYAHHAEREERENGDPFERFPPNGGLDEPHAPTLTGHLLSQLHLAADGPGELMLGEALIFAIDDDGYLEASLEEMAAQTNATTDEIERVLTKIQTFDPAGVGARNLRECLMLQLRDRGLGGSLAMRITSECFDDLTRLRHREITKALKVPEDEIREAIGVISRLNPRPGAANFGGDIQPIEPDLTVEKIDGEYVVSLNDGRIPSLRISPYYRKLLPRSAGTGEETRQYITDRLNHARWLIKAIEQRRSTMLKVMNTIVGAQREFLDHGIGRLRPMVLQEVADAIGMHASTVSRVTSGKYAQTPQGLYELKFFFDNRIRSTGGEDLASRSVREKMHRLITDENARKPLSDLKITEILQGQGIDIARRTVAKYRDQMRIPAARYRKQL
jgi:RNA polymerase sigma-54 factor